MCGTVCVCVWVTMKRGLHCCCRKVGTSVFPRVQSTVRMACSGCSTVCDAVQQSRCWWGSGRGRLIRLLYRLRVTESPTHLALLLEAAEACPNLATAYLGNCPLRLEARASPQWLAGCTALGRLLLQASACLPFRRLAVQRGYDPSPSPCASDAFHVFSFFFSWPPITSAAGCYQLVQVLLPTSTGTATN